MPHKAPLIFPAASLGRQNAPLDRNTKQTDRPARTPLRLPSRSFSLVSGSSPQPSLHTHPLSPFSGRACSAGGLLCLYPKTICYLPQGSRYWWSIEFERLLSVKAHPSTYLASGKIVLEIQPTDAAANSNSSPRPWKCQVCEEINEVAPTQKAEHPVCNICGLTQKGALRFVDSAPETSSVSPSPPQSLTAGPWRCSVCGDDNSFSAMSCASCGFKRDDLDHIQTGWPCPQCTFINHETLKECEMCAFVQQIGALGSNPAGPEDDDIPVPATYTLIFKGGGSSNFFDKLSKSLADFKVTLALKLSLAASTDSGPSGGAVGLSALLRRNEEANRAAEETLSTAFSDLDTLLKSAGEMVKLAGTISKKMAATQKQDTDENTKQSAKFRDLIDSLGVIGLLSDSPSAEHDHSASGPAAEVATTLAKLLTALAGKSRNSSRIFPLADIYCIYNRSALSTRASLISPHDLLQAATLFAKLNVPWRLHRFTKDGMLFVVGLEEIEPRAVFSRLQLIFPIDPEQAYEYTGLTATQFADRFGISIAIATEQLRMAEEAGFIVRDAQRKDAAAAFFSNLILPQ